VKKLYDGDECLSPEYGISPEPPYPQDTTNVVDYHLPSKLSCPIKNNELQLVLLYDSITDTIPNQGALYRDGVLVGFKLKWNDSQLVSIEEANNGAFLEFWNGQIFRLNTGGITSFRKGQDMTLKPRNNEVEIELSLYGDGTFPYYTSTFRVGTLSVYVKERVKDEWIWYLQSSD